MQDLIERQVAIEDVVRVCEHHAYDEIEELKALPPAQPETYKEKLNEIASDLSEKFAYMNTCPNERDVILGYLGVKRCCNTHCNTDCTNTKCESHPLSSAQPKIIMCKDCMYFDKSGWCDCLDTSMGMNDFCSMAERKKK